MAKLVPIDRQCNFETCPRFAVYIVRTRFEDKGQYCVKHAEQLRDAYNNEGAP